MKEISGWILLAIGGLCAIIFLWNSVKSTSSSDLHDSRSYFEREEDFHNRLSANPVNNILVVVGLICLGLGMYLIGMFGK